jgi:hypothetical protein
MNPPIFLLLIAVACMCGCTSTRSVQSRHDHSPVRVVDYSQAPEMKAMAEHARRFANQMYPQVVALLEQDGSRPSRQFDIVFARHVRGDQGVVLAQTRGSVIQISVHSLNQFRETLNRYASSSTNLDWYAPGATNLEMALTHHLNGILVHEMAHVAQRYRYWSLHFWSPPFLDSKAPIWWAEGLAYYAAAKQGYTNNLSCPRCLAWQDYTSDGWCTAAFLLHLDATYGSDVIRRLNTELRRGSYRDQFFEANTGKSLKELWAQFKQTPAFIPADAELVKFEQSLGYIDHKPPKDIDRRSAARVDAARSLADLRRQPGGALTLAAAEFLEALQKKGQLPGWSKDDENSGLDPWAFSPSAETHPVSRTIQRQKKGDDSTYHYLVVQESKDGAWKLQRAWRTGADGQTIAECAIP